MSSIPVLKVKRLHPDAVIPTFGTPGSIGLDLYLLEKVYLSGCHGPSYTVARTGIAVAIPPGYYGRIAPRSGLAVKHGVDVLAGVIDQDYRGEVMVVLAVHDRQCWSLELKAGERIAQLILERADRPIISPVDELDDTARGAGGFGSTGSW